MRIRREELHLLRDQLRLSRCNAPATMYLLHIIDVWRVIPSFRFTNRKDWRFLKPSFINETTYTYTQLNQSNRTTIKISGPSKQASPSNDPGPLQPLSITSTDVTIMKDVAAAINSYNGSFQHVEIPATADPAVREALSFFIAAMRDGPVQDQTGCSERGSEGKGKGKGNGQDEVE